MKPVHCLALSVLFVVAPYARGQAQMTTSQYNNANRRESK